MAVVYGGLSEVSPRPAGHNLAWVQQNRHCKVFINVETLSLTAIFGGHGQLFVWGDRSLDSRVAEIHEGFQTLAGGAAVDGLGGLLDALRDAGDGTSGEEDPGSI